MNPPVHRNADLYLADTLSDHVIATPGKDLMDEVAEDFGDRRALAKAFDRALARAVARTRRQRIADRARELKAETFALVRRHWARAVLGAVAASVAGLLISGATMLWQKAPMQIATSRERDLGYTQSGSKVPEPERPVVVFKSAGEPGGNDLRRARRIVVVSDAPTGAPEELARKFFAIYPDADAAVLFAAGHDASKAVEAILRAADDVSKPARAVSKALRSLGDTGNAVIIYDAARNASVAALPRPRVISFRQQWADNKVSAGSYRRLDAPNWIEAGQTTGEPPGTFNFELRRETESQILLFDPSRGMWIRIELLEKRIYFSDDQQRSWNHIYDITDVR
jgi:hypothetical protein